MRSMLYVSSFISLSAAPATCISLYHLAKGEEIPVACPHGEAGTSFPQKSEGGVKQGAAFPYPAPSGQGHLRTHTFPLAEAC